MLYSINIDFRKSTLFSAIPYFTEIKKSKYLNPPQIFLPLPQTFANRHCCLMSGYSHTMRIFFFVAILSIVAISCPAQDYIQYHKTFNKIDEDILSENYTRAIERLDSIYENYDFIAQT